MGGKAVESRRIPLEEAPERILGNIVRERREDIGLSQRGLAARTDLERSTIAYIEQGKRQPSLFTLLELAVGLELMPSELMHELETRINFRERFQSHS